MVLEVNLDDLVAESEHDGVLGPHPFLDVDRASRVLVRILLVQFVPLDQLLFFSGVIVLLEVGLEVLQQCHFLLQFLWVLGEAVLGQHVLLFIR